MICMNWIQGQLACLWQPWRSGRSGRAVTPLIARRCGTKLAHWDHWSLGSRHHGFTTSAMNDLVLNTWTPLSINNGETRRNSEKPSTNPRIKTSTDAVMPVGHCPSKCGLRLACKCGSCLTSQKDQQHLDTFGPWSLWSLRQWMLELRIGPLLVRLRSPLSTLSVAWRRQRLFRRSWKSSINCINISFTNLHSKCKPCDKKAWKRSAWQELQESPVRSTWIRQGRASNRKKWLHVTALDFSSCFLIGRYWRHSHTAAELAQQQASIISLTCPAVPCLTSICRIFASRCDASPCKL